MQSESSLIGVLVQTVALCRASAVENMSVLAGLFLTGLVGSLTHCAGMCGPFVLSQVAARLEAVPAASMGEIHRLKGALLLPYHLGRGTTYMVLGAVAAGAAATLGRWGGFRYLAAVLLIVAALVLLAMAFPSLSRLAPGLKLPSSGLGRAARRLLDQPTGWRGLALGLLLGFLPCGLLYAALAVAAASGSALAGALGMAAFTLGTVPALLAIGLVGHAAGRRWRESLLKWAPLLLVVNASVLAFMAVKMAT